MTDKQIIIDGVPVQDCCYFDYENDGYEDSCYIHQNECSAQNCYYKQLKRKEQECEELKLDLIEAKAHSNYLNNFVLSETLNLVSEQLEAYKMEAEEGKEINAELKADNKELKKILNEGCLLNLTLMTEKRVLLQTLTEIKEIARKIIEDYDGNQATNMQEDAKEILQKISECEVVND